MTKDVCITLNSIQTINGESEETELYTEGKLITETDSNIIALTYEESEATGFDGCSVRIEIDGNNTITMTRTGKSSSDLIMERGKKHFCHYCTEFGDFTVGINTDEIITHISENAGDFVATYTIDVNSSYLSDNEVALRYEVINND